MDADISEIKSTKVDTFEEVAGFLMGTGDWQGHEFAVQTSELVIGRTDDSDIVLNHRSVSARHAMLMTRHGRSRLLDLGSSNGTLVNGETYADVELQSGDRVQLGHTTFIYTTGFDAEKTRERKSRHNRSLQARSARTWALAPSATTDSASTKSPPLGFFIAALAVVAFGGWFYLNQGSDAAEQGLQAQPVPATPTSVALELSPREVESRLNEAKAAMTQRRWAIALDALNGLQGKVADNDAVTLTELRASALLNQSAESALLKAQQASAQESWDEAFNALSAIDRESVYFEEASGLKVRAQGALVDERVARIRRAIDQGSFSGSLDDDLSELQGLSPEKYAELSAELQAARERVARRNAEASRAKPTPRQTSSKPASRPAPKASVREAKAEAKPKPKPKPKPSSASGSSVSSKAIGYASTGTKAYNSGDYEGALAAFKLCLKSAPTYGNCLLGIGVAYEKLNNFPKAKENFVKFLKYAPEHKHAELVKKKLKRIESR